MKQKLITVVVCVLSVAAITFMSWCKHVRDREFYRRGCVCEESAR